MPAMYINIIMILVTAGVCFVVGYALKTMKDRSALREAKGLAVNARRDADAILKEAKISPSRRQNTAPCLMLLRAFVLVTLSATSRLLPGSCAR